MLNIIAVTGIRSEYFILQPVFEEIKNRDNTKLKIVVTGAHLSPVFGNTGEIVKNDGFEVIELETLFTSDTLRGRSKSIGVQIMGLTDLVSHEKPDWLVVLGDREESLSTASIGTYMNIPVAHLCGGDRVMGNIDDSVRHAVTKLAHMHFPATDENGERIIKMGEEPWRVNVVGNPALDSIRKQPDMTLEDINEKLGTHLSDDKPFILLIQHPLSSEIQLACRHMEITLEAVAELGINTSNSPNLSSALSCSK